MTRPSLVAGSRSPMSDGLRWTETKQSTHKQLFLIHRGIPVFRYYVVITSKSKSKTSFVTTDMKATVEYFQIQLCCLTCRNRKLEFLTFQFPRSLLLSNSPYCLPYHSYDVCFGELGIASTSYPPNLFICFYVCFRGNTDRGKYTNHS